MLNMSKDSYRTMMFSVLTILSIFFPWYTANIVLAHLNISPTQMNGLWVIVLLLGLIGMGASIFLHDRLRSLVDAIIGGLLLVTILITTIMMQNLAANFVQGLLSGSDTSSNFMSNLLSGSSGNDITQQISGFLLSESWGFYIVIGLGLAFLAFGLHDVMKRKGEKFFPENWHVQNKFQKVGKATANVVVKTSKNVQSNVKSSYEELTSEKKKKVVHRAVIGSSLLAVIIAGFFITMSVYNNENSIQATSNQLLRAVRRRDISAIQQIVVPTQKVSSLAWTAFANAWHANLGNFNSIIQSIGNSNGTVTYGSGNSASLAQDNGTPMWNQMNFLGFTHYQMYMPVFTTYLSNGRDINGNVVPCTYQLDGHKVQKSITLLNGSYIFTALAHSHFGPITQAITADETSTALRPDFTTDALEMTANDFSGGTTIEFNGKSQVVNFQNSNSLFSSNDAFTIPLFPVSNGDNVIAKLYFSSFGTYFENGTVSTGQDTNGNTVGLVTFATDPTLNHKLFETIGETINQFNLFSTQAANTGNYNNQALKYLLNGSSAYQNYTSNPGRNSSLETYVSAYLDPNSAKIYQTGDGAIGIQVNDTESYQFANGRQSNPSWTYGMEYDRADHTWKIESYTSSSETVTSSMPNAINLMINSIKNSKA